MISGRSMSFNPWLSKGCDVAAGSTEKHAYFNMVLGLKISVKVWHFINQCFLTPHKLRPVVDNETSERLAIENLAKASKLPAAGRAREVKGSVPAQS